MALPQQADQLFDEFFGLHAASSVFKRGCQGEDYTRARKNAGVALANFVYFSNNKGDEREPAKRPAPLWW